MKMVFLLFIVFSFFTISTSAQTPAWEYGIHGGLNINSGRGSTLNNGTKETSKGLNLGANLLYNISEHFGVKMMLQFDRNGWVNRGFTLEAPMGLYKADLYRNLDYINLPVLAMFNCGSRKMQFTGGAGIFAGYLLKNTFKINPTDPGSSPASSSSNSDIYKKPNYGLSASIGMQFLIIKRTKLSFNLMDNYGLANLDKGAGSAKTNALAGIVGLSFSCK